MKTIWWWRTTCKCGKTTGWWRNKNIPRLLIKVHCFLFRCDFKKTVTSAWDKEDVKATAEDYSAVDAITDPCTVAKEAKEESRFDDMADLKDLED